MSQTSVEIRVRCDNIVFPRKRWEATGTVQVLPGRLINVDDGYVHIVNIIECIYIYLIIYLTNWFLIINIITSSL